jgi:hypothetical protein
MVEVRLVVKELEGDSACRLVLLGYLSVPDLASYVTAPSILPLEVVPLTVPVGELTRSESTSGGALDIAAYISHALRESMSEIC